MHTNQDNVWERSKHIATDTEPPTEGGVPIMLFNAVLTDDSMFHSDTATYLVLFDVKKH